MRLPKFRPPTLPGEMLLQEFLMPMGTTQVEFARKSGLSVRALNEIIKGKRSINAEVAVLIEAALGISADFWLKAQNDYDLAFVKIQSKVQERVVAIAKWNMVQVAATVQRKRVVL